MASRTLHSRVHVIDHPLVQHKLTLMRKRETSSSAFRRLASEISGLLAYEVTRHHPLTPTRINTPMRPMTAFLLDGKKLVVISILRAGIAIADGIISAIPSARIGHIGLYRDRRTEMTVEYYFKAPRNMSDRTALVVDPMVATGHSAEAAIARVKSTSPKELVFICLIAAPEGVEYLHKYHPDVPIYCAAVDEGLDSSGYIVPGFGDAGDRIFGTK
ncbi:MAG: uracil phosphoribosyltransferase [bacterium]|nr:uracil phosphoribosyltransferase [Acidimicrobiia bacterium]MCY4649355.1 uracil phosphoribosyltransferase [bacterium]